MTEPLATLPPETESDPELLSLLRLLERAEGFTLAFLMCNVAAERERLVDLLVQSLKPQGRTGRVLHLQEPLVDLLAELRRLSPPLSAGDAVFVLGLERSIPADVSFPPVLERMNLARELYRDLPCPIVLVLPDYALTKLAREAPDFWAWRSGVAEVEVPAERLKSIAGIELAFRGDRELRSLSTARVRGHQEVLQELLAEYEERGDADRERLSLLNEMAAGWVSLGELEEARLAAEQALELARKVGDPGAEAEALNILAVALANLGRGEEAAIQAQTAVEAFRVLARDGSASAEAALASSLSNLGAILGPLGRPEEALAVLKESVGAHRRLAVGAPEQTLPSLAQALSNLGNVLGALGRSLEALSAAHEALEIRRRLAAEQPSLYLPDLAVSLKNCGALLFDAGRGEDSLAATEESVQILRDLAKRRPELFSSSLATGLSNLEVILRSLGRESEAAAVAEEARSLTVGRSQ
ncbi:MAG TPA: hypothetical protein DD490_35010 [Acidobacteria bacterium]|nr:hypothetical protein [Acidobacteriota bacterium]